MTILITHYFWYNMTIPKVRKILQLRCFLSLYTIFHNLPGFSWSNSILHSIYSTLNKLTGEIQKPGFPPTKQFKHGAPLYPAEHFTHFPQHFCSWPSSVSTAAPPRPIMCLNVQCPDLWENRQPPIQVVQFTVEVGFCHDLVNKLGIILSIVWRCWS